MFKKDVLSLIILFLILSVPTLNVSAEKIKILKAYASSIQDNNAELNPSNIIDEDFNTRWSSKFSDSEWIVFDMGKTKSFNKIIIFWENAYAKEYKIQISNDKKKWKTVFYKNNGTVGKDVIFINTVKSRYIRVYCLQRGTEWGYSIYEVKIMKNDIDNHTSGTKKSSEKIKIVRVRASSIEHNNNDLSPEKAVDGEISSRWSSDWSDPQWISFDFGRKKIFNVITVLWENAYAEKYKVQISNDNISWKTIYYEAHGSGGEEIIRPGLHKARFVRLYGLKRATSFGYSIYDLKIIRSDSKPPSPPSGVEILYGNNTLTIVWMPNSEEDIYGYNVYRSGGKSGKYLKVNTSVITTERFVDKRVRTGVRYYYIIKAVDYMGNESSASSVVFGIAKPIPKKGTYLDPKLSIEKRVKDLISRMTLYEKIEQLSGRPHYNDMTTYSNERLGIPPIKCTDGPYGVRWWKPSTAFPVSIALASTWDSELVKEVYIAIAEEVLAMGRNQSLGPCLNLCKDPRGGRTFEGFGEDVYLTTRLAVSAVQGIQSRKVIATPKHFVCNNIEVGRGGGPVKIDERTLRTIYMPAFEACIKEAGAWSIMGAYNKVNGAYCCANKHILRDILKSEWGFKGFVISDWFATHNTLKSANGGLDIEMPTPIYYGKELLKAVKNGLVTIKRIDDMVSRVLRVKFLSGLFNKRKKISENIIESKAHTQIALKAARKAIVLLKNKNNLLPLNKNKIKRLAVLGPNADKTTVGEGLGSSQLHSSYFVTPLAGIKKKLGTKVKISSNIEKADAVILFVGLTESIAGRVEGEGIDRTFLHLPGNQEKLINDVAQKNKNVIVVLIGGTAVTMSKWIDKVDAVLETWYSGQEGGTAIADVLFGDYNPGGRLPITFPLSLKQLPKLTWNYKNEYKTGIGYCYYEKKNIKPLFPFGFGLSYTRFEYSNLKISPKSTYNGVINITLDIKNIGKRKGDEIIQLYLQQKKRNIEGPIKQLKRFKRITLKPGEKSSVKFRLHPADMGVLDRNMKKVVEQGIFKLFLGSSSQDIRLSGEFKIARTIKVVK